MVDAQTTQQGVGDSGFGFSLRKVSCESPSLRECRKSYTSFDLGEDQKRVSGIFKGACGSNCFRDHGCKKGGSSERGKVLGQARVFTRCSRRTGLRECLAIYFEKHLGVTWNQTRSMVSACQRCPETVTSLKWFAADRPCILTIQRKIDRPLNRMRCLIPCEFRIKAKSFCRIKPGINLKSSLHGGSLSEARS
jgi:hypothetical protein